MNTTDPVTQTTQTPVKQGGTTGGTVVATKQKKVTTADLALIKTPSRKGIEAFTIPEKLKNNDPELVDFIIRSESMKDPERQYWFNLSEIMNHAQTEKLRDILVRERAKLAEIDAKYGTKKVDPVQAAKQAQELGVKRSAAQAKLRQKEAVHQAKEAEKEANILAELERL